MVISWSGLVGVNDLTDNFMKMPRKKAEGLLFFLAFFCACLFPLTAVAFMLRLLPLLGYPFFGLPDIGRMYCL